MIETNISEVVWCSYDILVLPPLHLKRYVGTNSPYNIFVSFFAYQATMPTYLGDY